MRPVVVFTGGGGAGSEALYRLLDQRYEVHFADADPSSMAASIPATRRHGIPLAGRGWAEGVLALCRELSAGFLVPGVDEELPLVRSLAVSDSRLAFVCPAHGFIELMKDKLRSMHELAGAGLGVPRTGTLDQASEFGFPCLVKPRDGRGSRGVQILQGPDEVAAYRVLARRPDSELLVQELLAGREWTVYVSADRRGTLSSVVPVRVDVKRGITVRAEVVNNEAILEYCVRLHGAFPTPGPYNVQMMEAADGRLATFEVNPRVSTTLCLAIAAGADPIADMMTDRAPGSLLPFRNGMHLRRFWFNDIGRR